MVLRFYFGFHGLSSRVDSKAVTEKQNKFAVEVQAGTELYGHEVAGGKKLQRS